MPGAVPPISSSKVEPEIERETSDGERAWIAGREGAAAFDRHRARGAGAAERTAVVNRDR